ncbi:hypothetical protein PBCVKS1B_319L [Paramecium bursaria Chlorella virus KS1B]|nr:hypothetical protein PBCVKS1B_319L [Paramecium bursaria Chlorella virus KS1B]
MPRPRLSESVKYERECDKISKTFARKMFSRVKKDFKKIEHSEAIMKRKAERVLNKNKKKQVVIDTIMLPSIHTIPIKDISEQKTLCQHGETTDMSTGFMFANLPNDILRNIYTKAIVLMNDDKKKAAIRNAALEVVDYLKISCDDRTSHAFSSSSDRLSIMKSCLGWVRQDGSGKYGSLSFRHGGYTQFNMKIVDGEYKINYISNENLNEFGKMVAESIKEEFNFAHVLVNKRRPTSGWINSQLLTKSIEDISQDTKISIYRLRKIIE